MQIGYLAHDLTDPAISRRVTMLSAGGARIALVGLCRGQVAHPDALVLGRSTESKLAQSALQISGLMTRHRSEILDHLGQPDILIARNLEMLTIAAHLLPRFRKRPRLVYECLDLHRQLTQRTLAGAALRLLERYLAVQVDLVLTSSPAFVLHHLARTFGERITIVENRVLELDAAPPDGSHLSSLPPLPLPGPPWRIGWFGALRCQKSLDILTEIARRGQGQIEIVIRGRPCTAIFNDFPAMIRNRPHMRFEGPYEQRELCMHYAGVHFAWGVDLSEAGANSDWLLPNRLYESVHYGSVPIARQNSEFGRFLCKFDIGLPLCDISPAAVARQIKALNADDYYGLLRRQRSLPRGMWMADRDDCVDLVRLLATDPALLVKRRITI